MKTNRTAAPSPGASLASVALARAALIGSACLLACSSRSTGERLAEDAGPDTSGADASAGGALGTGGNPMGGDGGSSGASGASGTGGGVAGAGGVIGSGGSAAMGGAGGTSGAAGAGGTDGGPAGSGGGDGGMVAMDGSTPPTSCVDVELGNASSGTANTQSAANDFTLSCASGTGADVVFRWTAPFTDYFTFSTAGSNFDTAAAVLTDCDSAELACNNNVGSSPQARPVARVEQGESYLIVVDGNSGERGDVSLDIGAVTCPGTDVTEQPLPATFSTVGGPNAHARDCVGESGTSYSGAAWPEKTFRYVASAAGLHRFSVTSTEFSPLLTVYSGVLCGGEYLQCNRNVRDGYPAEVTRWLKAGDAVTLFVEGVDGEGLFELDVERLPNDATDGCAGIPALGPSKSGALSTNNKELSSSCEWAGNDPTSGVGHYPEQAYRFSVDVPNAFSPCTVAVTAPDSPLLLYLLRGSDCSGPELQCEAVNTTTTLMFYDDDNGDYVLVVENTYPFGGTPDYQITSTCD